LPPLDPIATALMIYAIILVAWVVAFNTAD
jgi:hypothetical protein